MMIKPEDVTRVKGMGFLRNKETECFSARVITENGTLTAEQMENVCRIAREYGTGTLSFTTRLTVEFPGVKYDDIETVQKELAKTGLVTGGTGSRVRPVVSCKGTTCHYGLADTQGFAREIHEEFYVKWYDVKLPHKFKIAVGGCPNNCVKPDLNDFGIVGQHQVSYDPDLCNGCKKCAVETACPMNAAKVVDGVLKIDDQLCNNCGLCCGKCHFDAIEEGKYGYKIYLGGKWGKATRPGTPLPGIYSREEVMKIIEKTLLLYREQGQTGERFGIALDRIGFDTFVSQLLSDDILSRKEEILNAPLHLKGGAKC